VLIKNELKSILKDIDPVLCSAFATRAAMRVLPLLSYNNSEGAFIYWQKNKRSECLLSIIMAFQCVFYYPSSLMTRRQITLTAMNADNAARASHERATMYATAFAAARAAANYAVSITATESNNISNYIESTVIVTEVAANAATTATPAILKKFSESLDVDLKCIKAFQRSDPQAVFNFLKSPLWPGKKIPTSIQPLWKSFHSDALSLDTGFKIWLDWYQDRLDGKEIDQKLLENLINISEEIKAQGAKAVNGYLSQQCGKSLKPLNLVRGIFIGNPKLPSTIVTMQPIERAKS